MTAQTATLIAAITAAIAGVFAAVFSSRTARRGARETAQAQSEREISAFHREHVGRLKEMVFESAVALQALSQCCSHVPWLAKTLLADTHERGSNAIARINYAMEELKEMKAVTLEQTAATSGLSNAFQSFMGAIASYKEQLDAGNIALSGQANDKAKPAEQEMIAGHAKWQDRLNKLKVLVAQIRALG
jgi:hypothetical protein